MTQYDLLASEDTSDENSAESSEYSDKSALVGSSKSSYGTDNNDAAIAIDERLTYTWKEIDVYGEQPKEGSVWSRTVRKCFTNQKEFVARKHLLKNVTGVAHSGELLAVMGASGAGKTTLLNCLSFRSPPGVKISSTSVRALNGIPVNSDQLRSQCAYVQQDDLFIASLTTREHLIFQAMLRMSRRVPYDQKIQRVNEVLSELSLRKCANTIIGAPGRIKGLSGGERKRLAFASETLTDPHLLLCDEPTSGLDSFMAHSVLQVLKRMSRKGKTIIVTIHQPSSELYGMFDKILLIAEGRTAFLGTPDEAANFFDVLGVPCPVNYNPADYFVQILAIAPNREQECRATIKKICDTFAVSPLAKDINTVASNIGTHDEQIAFKCKTNGNGYRASWWIQFYAILWRSWLSVLKEPMLVKVRILQTTMVSFLIGIIFYGQVLDQDGVMNMNGALFLFLTNMTFQNVFAVINVFSSELPIFIRESRARLYRTSAYFLGKTIAELPLFLAVPIIFTSIAYPMIGLRQGFYYFTIACGVVSLVANVSTSFGYLISCASSSISMALSIGPPVIIPFLIFGGFFLNSGSVPSYFTWLSYLSWFRYGNEALTINQWTDVDDIICTRSNTTCPTSGKVILETLNFDTANFYWDLLALVVLIIVFRTAAYICLVLRSRSKE